MCSNQNLPTLHVAFYPWFALGHLTSFLRLANKLAERGHKVSYFLPSKTQYKLAPQNHYPDYLTFIPITVPPVDGLPSGAETTNDVPASARPLLMTAMDMTRETIEAHLIHLKPNIVFYDFTCWIPELAQKHGFKSVHYITSYIARYAYISPKLKTMDHYLDGANLVELPPSFPSPFMRMQIHEAKTVSNVFSGQFGLGGMTLAERLDKSFHECDAIGVKTCNEMEEAYCDYIGKVFGKPVVLAGPMIPRTPSSKLDKHLAGWLHSFSAASVIYCALGSECVLRGNQFQELVLGLELTGRPFLAALKPPTGYETVESAFPEGFADRIKGRGIIDGGWVQQQQILKHPSVGCFITHCGAGSLSEAMASECQVVLMPQAADQFIIARLMSLELKIGVEVEQSDNNVFYTRESISKAVTMMMEEGSEVGREVRENHAKWREIIMKDGLEDSYISSFIQSLQQLIG